MIRLTVLYNLPPETDEQAFLEWRLGEHQASNVAIPGVVASAFHRVLQTADGNDPPYRFMTTLDWLDRGSFERGFYDQQVQAEFADNLKRIRDAVFLISESLTE